MMMWLPSYLCMCVHLNKANKVKDMFSFSKIKYQTYLYKINKNPPSCWLCVAGKSKATWSNFNYKCLLIMNIWLWFCLGHILCILFVVGKHSNSLFLCFQLSSVCALQLKLNMNGICGYRMWYVYSMHFRMNSIRNNNNNNDNNRTEPRDAFNVKYDYIQWHTHDKCMCTRKERWLLVPTTLTTTTYH